MTPSPELLHARKDMQTPSIEKAQGETKKRHSEMWTAHKTGQKSEQWVMLWIQREREKDIALLNMLENRSESHVSQPPSLYHSGRQKDGGSI